MQTTVHLGRHGKLNLNFYEKNVTITQLPRKDLLTVNLVLFLDDSVRSAIHSVPNTP